MNNADLNGARVACTELIVGFAYCVDRRRYDDLVALFDVGGVFTRPGFKAEGHAEILAYFVARPEGTESRHVCAPSFFETVTENSATAITYVTMFHGLATADDSPVRVAGVAGVVEFHDAFVLTAAGWRIANHQSRVTMVQAD